FNKLHSLFIKTYLLFFPPILAQSNFFTSLMKVLIKRARVFSPPSPFHGKSRDILIENGIISEIENEINTAADTTIEIDDLHISGGWMDCFANFCDPGQEFKETLESGSSAAAAGGFTEVML